MIFVVSRSRQISFAKRNSVECLAGLGMKWSGVDGVAESNRWPSSLTPDVTVLFVYVFRGVLWGVGDTSRAGIAVLYHLRRAATCGLHGYWLQHPALRDVVRHRWLKRKLDDEMGSRV